MIKFYVKYLVKVKFDCRISKELKSSLSKKATEAGLTDSEFIRIMLNENFDIIKLINVQKYKLTLF